MLTLRQASPSQWVTTVIANLDSFLPDHASAEYKASGMAMSMALHYKDKNTLVSAMIDLAIEELAHFREVVKVMASRGINLQKDEKDPYVNGLRQHLRKGNDAEGNDLYFLDRLLIAAIIEARGAERFGLIATALPTGALKEFYHLIARSEDKHYALFLSLADDYFPKNIIAPRLDELLQQEAALVASLPIRAKLH